MFYTWKVYLVELLLAVECGLLYKEIPSYVRMCLSQ